MNNQFLQYIREELITATADMSGRTKGQLVAFAENGLTSTVRCRRKRRTQVDEVTGKVLTIFTDPVPGTQTRVKGFSKVLIEPVQFSTASWRRALSILKAHEHAWLSWCYAGQLEFVHQEVLTRWIWAEYQGSTVEKKVAGKTLKRLKSLVWLAAQDIRAEINGAEIYSYTCLAMLVGVNKTNWSQNYSQRWEDLRKIAARLDALSLKSVAKSRSQQKAAIYNQSLAKMN